LKKAILSVIWLAVIASLICYLGRHYKELKQIFTFSLPDIALIGLLIVVTQYMNGLRNKIILDKLGVRLSYGECFHLSNMNTMANYLPLKGGTVAIAVYFKNRHNITYTRYVNMAIASQILQLLTISFVSFFLIIVAFTMSGSFLKGLFYFFWLLFVSMLVAVVVMRKLAHAKELFGFKIKRVNELVREANTILEDKKLLSRMFLINIFTIAIMGLRFFEAFKMLSYKAPVILSILSGQVKTLAMLINITPSGIGVAEVSAGLISGVASNNVNIGIYAATIDRVISILVMLVICLFSIGNKAGERHA
jgi:uncharacterized protein (TIRG00374 family)